MTGGLIQLVAYGIQDIFLTGDPQITFFKIVYRRHTNFSIEAIPQLFDQRPDFGRKVTSTVTRAGDLIGATHLILDLPALPPFYDDTGNIDPIKKVAFVRKVGYAVINYVSVEIGGQLIDRQYGEWMNIWSELTEVNMKALDIMIGNIKENYTFDTSKNSYRLFIPLHFWFCRHHGLALPILCLQYNEVKFILELNDKESCYMVGPTHSMQVIDDIVHFQPFEYIEQVIDGVSSAGIFMSYDVLTKKIYYIKVNNNIPIQSLDLEALYNSGVLDRSNPDEAAIKSYRQPYLITGLTSNAIAYPQDNTLEQEENTELSINIHIPKCFLLVNYYFLDTDERMRFMRSKHEYLIEQVQYCGESVVQSTVVTSKLALGQPCKELVWVAQLDYIAKAYLKDYFNYTNSYQRFTPPEGSTEDVYIDYEKSYQQLKSDIPLGTNLVYSALLSLNGQARMERRPGAYYNFIHPYQHHTRGPSKGINIYCFALKPENLQPSGTCNMTRVDNINLDMQLQTEVDPQHQARTRVYATNYNILRIMNGLAGVVFIN
jgi:hypothetical protein